MIEHLNFERENKIVRKLVEQLGIHDTSELGHSDRVSVYCTATGYQLGIRGSDLRNLRYAAMLHDIGKLKVDRILLTKLGKLTDQELQELRAHSIAAESIVESIPWLAVTIPSIRHHHERFDGQGYPDGLSKEQIPQSARIIALCEAYDVLLCGAPWRRRLSEFEALAELERNSGTQFDPKVLEAFFLVQPKIQPITSSES